LVRAGYGRIVTNRSRRFMLIQFPMVSLNAASEFYDPSRF
jgi:hypothetical protein